MTCHFCSHFIGQNSHIFKADVNRMVHWNICYNRNAVGQLLLPQWKTRPSIQGLKVETSMSSFILSFPHSTYPIHHPYPALSHNHAGLSCFDCSPTDDTTASLLPQSHCTCPFLSLGNPRLRTNGDSFSTWLSPLTILVRSPTWALRELCFSLG